MCHSTSLPPTLGGGPSSHSLVVEILCAEVVKEFVHDLVVIHDLHDPLLHGQVVMRAACVGPPKWLSTKERWLSSTEGGLG